MKTISKIICAICLTFSLVGCLAPQFKKEVRKNYSVSFNGCFCQWYNLNEFKKITELKLCENFFQENACTGDEEKDKPDCFKVCSEENKDHYCYDQSMPNIEYCDDLIGYSAKNWAISITPKGRELRRFLMDKKLTKKAKKALKRSRKKKGRQ